MRDKTIREILYDVYDMGSHNEKTKCHTSRYDVVEMEYAKIKTYIEKKCLQMWDNVV